MSSPKSHRHIHGAGGLKFDLTELHRHYADCVRLEDLPELKAHREFYENILDEVDGKNYESLYDAAVNGVTTRNTEIDRLQRVIYNMLPHEEAAAIINDTPMATPRTILHETETNKLKQKLDATRVVRDKVAAQETKDIIGHAYRIVAAQGAVGQAKKALYIQMRKDHVDPFKFGSEVKHREL